MAVTTVAYDARHEGTVGISAAGSTDSSSSIASDVPTTALEEALTTSLTSSGLFEAVVPVHSADYLLAVMVVSVDKPMIGFDMSVTSELAWSLTRLSDNKTVWSESIRSTATKGMGDELVGASRVRAAVEGSIQNNIRQALQTIAMLELSGDE